MMTTGVGTALHFLVDGLCACCLFLLAEDCEGQYLLGLFLTYNVLAFLTQPLSGMLADRVTRHQQLLALSVTLLASGVAVTFVSPLLTAVLLGLGNSLFHVWGGRQVAVTTGNDIRSLGVFVSTGAFGLAVGMVMHDWLALDVFLVAIVVLAVLMLRQSPPSDSAGEPSLLPVRLKPWMVWGSLLVLMAVVMLRSLIGESFSSDMVKGGAVMLTIGFVAMLGKAAGGFLAKTMGIVWSMALVLIGVVAVLGLTSHASPLIFPAIGLLLVNLTMAVTLYLANLVMPGREGLAFGLLAAALMPGYLLAQLSGGGFNVIPSLLATLLPTIVIELIVLWALRERRADVLWSSVVVNILTNVPLNLIVTYVSNSLWVIIAGETLVVLVEALWYWYFLRDWRQAFLYSFLCNGISYLVGLLSQLVILLF